MPDVWGGGLLEIRLARLCNVEERMGPGTGALGRPNEYLRPAANLEGNCRAGSNKRGGTEMGQKAVNLLGWAPYHEQQRPNLSSWRAGLSLLKYVL